MSTFIDKADYGDSIKDNILDDITEMDDDKLDKAEIKAISKIKGYLNSRYDVENIFNKTGDDRNPVIVQIVIDTALYFLHSRINYRKIPAFRMERYNEWKEWLEDVSASKINPPDLPLLVDGSKDYMRFGSNTKRNNHI